MTEEEKCINFALYLTARSRVFFTPYELASRFAILLSLKCLGDVGQATLYNSCTPWNSILNFCNSGKLSKSIGSEISWRMNSKLGSAKRWSIFLSSPVEKLSTQMTLHVFTSSSQRWEPINPAPPVTKTFFLSKIAFLVISEIMNYLA